MAKQDTQKREASRSRVSSKKGPCHIPELASMTEGAANQEDWSAALVADPVQEAMLLTVWETKILQDDGGENTSLAKREC
jgi:hypothetical protein